MSIFSAITPVITGLGLFFIGTRFMASNLAALAGGSARKLIRRTLGSRRLSVIGGLVAGVVTQSPNSVALIMVSLARTGIASGRSGALVTVWSNVGASALVILVAINTNAAAAYLLAAVGVILYLDLKVSEQTRHALLASLGIGLLLMGLGLLKGSSGQLREVFVTNNILQAGTAPPVTLLVGAAMAIATQSSTVASATAVALVHAGFFDLPTTLLLIAGANGGNGINYALHARRGHSDGRHILMFQATQKIFCTTVLLLPLLIWPGAAVSVIQRLPFDVSGQLAWVFLATQIAGTIACTVLNRPLYDIFGRLAPGRREEALGRPVFLVEEALGDAPLALELAEQELIRLVRRLPLMLEGVRADGKPSPFTHDVLLVASKGVASELRRYIADIIDHRPGYETIIRCMELQQGLTNILFMLEAVSEFAAAVQLVMTTDRQHQTVGNMVESLHLVLEVLVDALEHRADDEHDMAQKLLMQRGDLLEGLRMKMLADRQNASAQIVEAQFQITVVFERILWLGSTSLQILVRGRERESRSTVMSPDAAFDPGPSISA
jgi:phosphate:Na+ symporter